MCVSVPPTAQGWICSQGLEAQCFGSCELAHLLKGGVSGAAARSPALMAVQQSDTHENPFNPVSTVMFRFPASATLVKLVNELMAACDMPPRRRRTLL